MNNLSKNQLIYLLNGKEEDYKNWTKEMLIKLIEFRKLCVK